MSGPYAALLLAGRASQGRYSRTVGQEREKRSCSDMVVAVLVAIDSEGIFYGRAARVPFDSSGTDIARHVFLLDLSAQMKRRGTKESSTRNEHRHIARSEL